MAYIALLMPACISVYIYDTRNGFTDIGFHSILEYSIWNMSIYVIVQGILVYILKVQATQDALMSFPFFVKYVLLSCSVAMVLPMLTKIYKNRYSIHICISSKESNNGDVDE